MPPRRPTRDPSSREEFDLRYWGKDYLDVPAMTRRDFYSDWRESGLSFTRYKRETSMSEDDFFWKTDSLRRNPARRRRNPDAYLAGGFHFSGRAFSSREAARDFAQRENMGSQRTHGITYKVKIVKDEDGEYAVYFGPIFDSAKANPAKKPRPLSRAENPRRRVRPATRRNPEPRYTLLGVDDEVVVCEKCGKADLKCTVVLGVLDADGNIDHEVRFGRDCAAKALRKPRTVTAAKMEKLARGAEFKRVLDMTVGAPSRVKIEGNRWTNYYFSYRLTDGRTLIVQESDPSFRPPAGSWTRLREGAWVGHPASSNPRRRTAR